MADDSKTKVPAAAGPVPATSPPDAAPTLPPDMPTGAGATVPEAHPPAMPTVTGSAIPLTTPPEMPSVEAVSPGTIQVRPGQAMPSAGPVMPTLTGPLGAPPDLPLGAPPAMPDERYTIGDEIARGGMGRVVEAVDTVLGRTVALKEALALDADALKRFTRETQITARLEHPAIVPVHDAGFTSTGAPFYVMRKISGRPLERLVALAETLDERLALVPHIVAAAMAVAHAHERGIVHRDIKPSNILVGDLAETIVIDWGLAKLINEADDPLVHPVTIEPLDLIKTRAGIVYGTPGFMAPEQLRGKPVNERCDVYALGATLYHLLSRRPPHHAKTADEMMKAAAHAPPPPITEVVAGVPPELSTIIDKCLAHDPAARYPNARELAEDLQRFLAGQLVASHHYSTTERAKRFIKKNKVPVAALGVLLLGLILAYVRVRGERDRADDAARTALAEKQIAQTERLRAERELERVTLQQAKNEVETNPTRALARIHGLAAKHPRDVRAIAIAARAAGVAWALPASKSTFSLEVSRDGQRVLAAGEDGVLRLYELANRGTRTVAQLADHSTVRFADDERRIVAWKGTSLTVMDTAGTNRREVTTPTAIRDLEVVGITAYWVDLELRFWRFDLAGATPVEIALPEPVREIAPSPDGRWIALYAEDHLLLFDRTAPTAEPVNLTNGRTVSVDWSPDGSRLAALVDQQALTARMDPVPFIEQRRTVGERSFVAWGDDHAYSIGPTGVAVIPSQVTTSRKPLVGDPINIVEARGKTIVAASQAGIAVLAASGDLTLTVPTGRLGILEASAASPYVVGTIEDHLLVWNLDDIQARRIPLEQPLETAGFVGNHHVLASSSEGLAWIDLATGKLTALGARVPVRDLAGAPSGALACVVDTSRKAFLVRPGTPLQPLDGTASLVGFPTERDLILADEEAGVLRRFDVEALTYTTLISGQGHLASLAWSRQASGWLAAAFTDGTLWRQNLLTGDHATATDVISATSRLLVTTDGTVMFAEARKLRAWRPDGSIDAHAELPRPIAALGIAGAGPAIVFTQDGATYTVALDARDRVEEVEPVGAEKAAMSVETGIYVVSNVDGIDLVDPLARYRWTLAHARGASYRDPQISADGRRVFAHTRDALLVWTLPDPPTQDATTAWLGTLTNATIDPATGRLSWQ